MQSDTNVVADPRKPFKAYAAAAIAFLGLLWANLQGVEDWGSLGVQDWLTIIVPTILTFGGTYLVENPKTTTLWDHRERGAVDVVTVLVVAVLVVLLVILVGVLR